MKLLLSFLCLVLISCNSKKKNEVILPPRLAPALGTYTLCENDSGISAKTVVLFNEEVVMGTLTLYQAANCPAGQELFIERDIYSYTSASTTSFNMTVQSIVIVPSSGAVASSFNTDSFCGYTNWSSGIPKQVTGRNCGGVTLNRGDTSVQTIYSTGGNLVMEAGGSSTTYQLVQSLDLSGIGQTFPSGIFTYYNGQRGIHLTSTGANYQVFFYDDALKLYYSKSGSITSADNQATFTWTNSAPVGCNVDAGPFSLNFVSSNSSLGLESLEFDGSVWLMDNASVGNTQFRDFYLLPGYSQGCF